MRFLLVLISFIFSFIFYLFDIKIVWESIFFAHWTISLIFFIVLILFFIYFSDFKKNKEKTQINFKELLKLLCDNIITLVFLLIFPLWLHYIFNILWLNYYFMSLIYFILSISFYFLLINIKYLKNKKDFRITVKYLSLIFVYLSTVFWILYTIKNEENYLIYFILFCSICFNLFIHFKFKNFISLFFSISTIIFFLYQLFPLLDI